MTDREKVIEELERVVNAIVNGYIHEPARTVNAIADAIAMLKERELLAVEEGKVNKCVCGNEINRYWHPEYCGFCEKKLKWY